MPKTYALLRRELTYTGNSLDDLAYALHISTSTVSKKICGKFPWTQTEMFAALGFLKVEDPAHYLGEYFPPFGVNING